MVKKQISRKTKCTKFQSMISDKENLCYRSTQWSAGSDSHFMFVENFRLIDYVMLLHETIHRMTLKGLISICSQ